MPLAFVHSSQFAVQSSGSKGQQQRSCNFGAEWQRRLEWSRGAGVLSAERMTGISSGHDQAISGPLGGWHVRCAGSSSGAALLEALLSP